MGDLWGLWHDGWCYIDDGRYAGTLAEVQVTLEQFVLEGNDGSTYHIVPFDRNREPLPRPGKEDRRPSPLHVELLRYCMRHGHIYRFGPRGLPSKATRHVMQDAGWIMVVLGEDGREVRDGERLVTMRLTKLGEEVLALAEAATGSK